jgi:lipoprotein-anchoring transpeptidase ErfK/SrfK
MARHWRTRWSIVVALVGVLALSLAAGCTGSSAGPGPGGSGGGDPAKHSAKLTFAQADNATVSPADPITVQVADGTLETVSLTNAEGRVVSGGFDTAHKMWTNSEPLGYGKAYTIAAKGVGDDGQPVEETRTFTTVKPGNYTLPYLRANATTLLDGGTYGVGQPAVIWFDEPITNRTAAERAITVTTEPQTIGAFRWINDHEVHWRPKEYWGSGTKITVTAKVYGVDLGNGLYGQEDRTASFTIGPSKIAVVDDTTKRMKVYIDGNQVTNANGVDISAGIPVSLGQNAGERAPNGTYVDFRTQSGPHVVLGKADEVRMTSASYGLTDKSSPNYYDSLVKKAVQISGDGEYVHLADWNIPQHGNTNTSHGCVNVAPTFIYWFYDTFGTGDVVDVQNTGRALPLGNGIADWVLPWDEWIKAA